MTERTVRQIIEGQAPLTAAANVTVREASGLMKQHNVGSLMVVDNEKLVGVFTERDGLFRVLAEGRDADTTALADVMTRNPQTIKPSCTKCCGRIRSRKCWPEAIAPAKGWRGAVDSLLATR
jgi:CBS domain-containing protein